MKWSRGTQSAQEIISGLKAYRKKLEEKCGLKSDIARFLVKSADQFISARESTGGETILAGFPFLRTGAGYHDCASRNLYFHRTI